MKENFDKTLTMHFTPIFSNSADNIITPRCTCSRKLIKKKKTFKDRENQVLIGLGCHRDGFNLSLPGSFFLSLQRI